MAARILNMPGKIRVLWLGGRAAGDCDPLFLQQLSGCTVDFAPDAAQGLRLLRAGGVDVVMAELPLSGSTADDLLAQVRRIHPTIPVIVRDPDGTMADAVRWGRLGADQVLTGPVEAADLRLCLQAALGDTPASDAVPPAPWRQFLVGESPAMAGVDRIIRLIGPRRCTVLITGETGTGKEMAARAIHLASPRAARPMVAVNCSALPENLLEAELFGHVKGAFTGALQQRAGRFEQAHLSTLFLDEIGDLPLELQAKLLRVLQEREFQRLGSSETVRVDVRVIAAANVDLEQQVEQGRFREDLYYRLRVVPISMPPLRERPGDIPALVAHFVSKVCRLEQMPLKQLAPETLECLAGWTWPGNVRQLENAVEMAVVLSGERAVLYPADFPLSGPAVSKPAAGVFPADIPVPDAGLDFARTVSHFERSILEQALRKTGGNKKLAADMLRLKRTTLSAKLRSLQVAV